MTQHRPLDPRKFRDPLITAAGEARAVIAPGPLRTLWVNTGTLCNITCASCYIESSPRNDALAYISAAEVGGYLDEIIRDRLPVTEIGFTGGEPFLNRALPAMLEDALCRGFRVLVLTNGMKPMRHHEAALLGLRARFGDQLTLRVSIDHPDPVRHDAERQAGSFTVAMDGLRWLAANGFRTHVAGRVGFDPGGEAAARAAFAAMFAAKGLAIDADDPAALTLFPEMDARLDVPEITTACWGILGKRPDSIMCASARMVVKRRGAARPAVLACTLLAYDPAFELGETLAEAARPVPLNHPHCAKFCVLGGAACSR